ncbi:glycoside hydrolase family 65 central catalytic [Segniliparus rotundus DSM 44985]|uniref:Glycoside hydrolase family 65 central catalytic n=2 Tax=Segniliparus rotundus TaxID=286802 RepID=D6ZCS8_SEGRD|nr:glycoside hydrolase family 65 central catalytic [Segniliparus rotundus DSM 44985]
MKAMLVVAAVLLLLAAGYVWRLREQDPHAQPGRARPAAADPQSWVRAATKYTDDPYARVFLGNGRIGTTLAGVGQGYESFPGRFGSYPLLAERYTGTFVAGYYDTEPLTPQADEFGGDEVIVGLPAWSGLSVAVGGKEYAPGVDPAELSDFRQTLDERRAVATTHVTWTPQAGRALDLTYRAFVSRAEPNLAAISVQVVPRFDGQITVTGLIDGRAARRARPEAAHVEADRLTSAVVIRADGPQGRRAAVSSVFQPAQGSTSARAEEAGPGSAQIAVDKQVEAGAAYTFTKYVGIATEDDDPDPEGAARRAAFRGAAEGWDQALAAHERDWADLWASDIVTAGQRDFQSWIHSSFYALFSSVRAGARWSVPPAGLSSDDYAGWLFWDAGTWIFPTLLATHPELARAVVDMRANALGQARANAKAFGYRGAAYPWNNGPAMRCLPNPYKCVRYEEHLENEIALAQWQYYLATGDRQWLADKGAPVITAIADYLVSRIGPPGADGAYHYRETAGADEYIERIDDHALTVVGAKNTLRAAQRVRDVLGQPADPAWAEVADHLAAPPDIAPGVPAEYSGYHGQQIKQADTVLLSYPFDDHEPGYSEQATVDYYFPRTDPTGPNMTNGMGAILEAQLGQPGCATDTFLDQASGPYIKGPFDMSAEVAPDTAGGKLDPVWHRNEAAWIFVTGQASFLQALLVGPTGARFEQDALRLDPLLPKRFAQGGLRITGFAYRGSRLDIDIGPKDTTVRLVSGGPARIAAPDGNKTVAAGQPVTIPTRRPDLAQSSDVALCRPVTATSSAYNSSPAAAVDGSAATVWRAAGDEAALTVDLGATRPIHEVALDFGATPPQESVLEISAAGDAWTEIDARPPAGTQARFVRVTLRGAPSADGVTGIGKGSKPTLSLAELSVR